MITRLRYPKGYQFFNANGAPLALGNLYYYVGGTTTPQDTYSDSAGTAANTNPIVLDGSGRLGVDVYLGSTANYKEVLTASSAIISPWPDDNIPLATQAGSGATDLSITGTATSVGIGSSCGTGITIPAATSTAAGVLDADRAAKIDGLASVATSGSYADLANKPSIPSSLSGQNIDNVARLGINTADTGNRLSVNAPSVLFSNSGDMRAAISKGASSNTAAWNFQDNFSTRVQLGLLGSDNFTISSSPDGSTFNNAIVATTAGAVSFPNTGGFTGDSGSGGGAGVVPAPGCRHRRCRNVSEG